MGQKLKSLLPSVETYFMFKNIAPSGMAIKNRRQFRLWKVLSRPYNEFINELRNEVFKQIEEDILYGKGVGNE